MNWLKMALQLRGSVAPIIFPRVLACSSFGFVISILSYFGLLPISGNIFGNVITNVAFNLVLGLLLVFRTNTAYERFWEGRKNWGILVMNVRNLARQIRVAVATPEPADREGKVATLRLLAAFAVATKLHLREEPVNSELEALITPSEYLKLKELKSPPLQVALWIGDYLQQQQKRNIINENQLYAMNCLLDKMVEALTSCEGILTTPIPLAYGIYLKRLVLIYCILLPLQIVNEVNWWTSLVVAIISFTLLGIEQIGNEIENPFGYDPNDLPLDEICTNMLQNIEELITVGSPELELNTQTSTLTWQS